MATGNVARHSERKPLQTPTRSAVGFGWEKHPASSPTNDLRRPPPRGLHPKERLSTPQMWVPRSCQADVGNLHAVTGLGEPHRELHPEGGSPPTVHTRSGNVTSRPGRFRGRPAAANQCRSVLRNRCGSGLPRWVSPLPALPDLKTCGMLRRQPLAPCHRACHDVRSPRRPELRARRELVLELPDGHSPGRTRSGAASTSPGGPACARTGRQAARQLANMEPQQPGRAW